MLDSLLEGAAQQTLFFSFFLFSRLFSLSNQCSILPSPATTMSQDNIPYDGLLRPPRTPYGLRWSLKGPMDRYRHIRTHPSEEIGFSAGEAPLTAHQAQGDMSEVRT